jgi:beta-phosphoglucomutase-like phosphatase (HAD superfamily)
VLKAIIFDFDGVVADTEPLHLAMFQRVLEEDGLTLSERDYFEKYVGLDDKGCFQAILAASGRATPAGTIPRLVERKAVIMLEHLKTHLVIFPGVGEFVTMAAAGHRLAIASGALRHEIEYILDVAGIRLAFEHITAAEDVRQGKPDPEAYLYTLHRLNQRVPVAAPECLVIEDTIPGIQAAHAAGMRCLAVSNTCPADQLTTADAVTATLKGYDLETLRRRFWN